MAPCFPINFGSSHLSPHSALGCWPSTRPPSRCGRLTAGAQLLDAGDLADLLLIAGHAGTAPVWPGLTGSDLAGSIMAKIDEYPFGKLTIQLHAVTTDPPAPHPHIAPNVPADFRILGVGAAVDPPDAASFLTAMWPVSSSEWDVAAKDHIVPSPARVTAFCVAASNIGGNDYFIAQDTTPAPEPHLVGGGARVNWNPATDAGSLLYASRPGTGQSWHAAAKDHMIPSPATVTAFAIGLSRRFLDDAGLTVVRMRAESMTQVASPEASCGVNDAAATLIAGGAETHWSGPGSLLTQSGLMPSAAGPRPWLWAARGTEHQAPDPSTVTSWALALVAYR